jgi:hypothetical protein
MLVRLRFLLSVVAAGASACASAPVVEEAPALGAFEKHPPKPPGCAFDLFEERPPPRPYRVLGTLPLSTNNWLGARKRKALLRKTVCEAGADAVYLPRPEERAVGNLHLREYLALFIIYTDGPQRGAPDAPTPPPPSGEDYTVPISEELMGDTHGTEVREQQAAPEADWE